MSQEPIVYRQPGISTDDIDPDALKVVERLYEGGAPALFVGGCVRDLLLGRKPKDFDVVTPFSLRRVRRIFRANSRVIGRRHRLVHVFFEGGKVVEVSTYPRPEEEEGSTPGDWEVLDAFRRDFTANALYYDPIRDTLIDYVRGHEDVRSRILRSISSPRESFESDPVRIVRGIRYACLLDFTIEEATGQAMKELAWMVARANKRRMQEELWKFLLAPRTDRAFRTFADLGIFAILFPEVTVFLDPEGPSRIWDYLAAKDEVPREELTHALAMAIFFLPLLDEVDGLGEGDPELELERLLLRCRETVEPIGRVYSLARKVRYGVLALLDAQLRMLRGPDGRRSRLVESLHFEQALRLFKVFCRARGTGADVLAAWEAEAGSRKRKVEPRRAYDEVEEVYETARGLGPDGEPRPRRRRRSRSR